MKTLSKILVFALIFILAGLTGSSLAAKTVIPQEDERNRAIENFHEGKFDQALPVFQKLANAYPADYLLKYFTGASLIETGSVGKEAEMYLLLAITRDVPAKVFYYLGRLYHAQGNWDGALRFYNRFINNSDANQVAELRIKELSDLAYNQVNPFKGKDIVWPQANVEMANVSSDAPINESNDEPAPQPDNAALDIPEVVNVPEPDSITLPPVSQLQEPERMDTAANEVPTTNDTTRHENIAMNRMVETDSSLTANMPVTPEPVQFIDNKRPSQPTKASLPYIEFIHFRINSRVNYLTKEMFKLEEAKEAWRQGMVKEKLLNEKLVELQQLRNQYGSSQNLAERDKLAAGIIQLERETLTLNNELEILYGKARQLEQDWWSKAGEQEYENLRFTTDSLQKLEEAIRKASLTPPPTIDQQLIEEFAELQEEEPTTNEEESTENKVIYKIQLGSFTKAVPPRTKELFDKIAIIRPIETFIDEKGATVYTTGNMKTFADGLALQNQVRMEGVKDAFVIAILNEKRISLQEAKTLTGEE